ncbi:hypothetical protein Scep_005703 [Stephania cephalantha]|uniref:Uncharacterized protein n=1 Tax=Stephania cephalantha TaxID=152367 RepID=A0AAP0PYF6_9MAGN
MWRVGWVGYLRRGGGAIRGERREERRKKEGGLRERTAASVTRAETEERRIGGGTGARSGVSQQWYVEEFAWQWYVEEEQRFRQRRRDLQRRQRRKEERRQPPYTHRPAVEWKEEVIKSLNYDDDDGQPWRGRKLENDGAAPRMHGMIWLKTMTAARRTPMRRSRTNAQMAHLMIGESSL